MPYRRRSSNTKRRYARRRNFKRSMRRNYYRKRRVGRYRLSRARFPLQHGFPNSTNIKMPITGRTSITVAVGTATGEFILNANDIFDPLGTIAAVKPQYFSEMYGVYINSYVYRSDIRISCTHVNTNADMPLYVNIWPDTSSAPPVTGFADQCVQPFVRKYLVSSLQSKPTFMHHSMTTKKILGQNKADYEDLLGNVLGSPATKTYWRVNYSYPVNVAGTAATLYFRIHMVQHVKFQFRKAAAVE